MRIVVVGATGNIGLGVVEQLAGDPVVQEIVGLARRIPARPPHEDRVTYCSVDVTCDDLAPYLVGADVVVHLAWALRPMHDPRRTWEVNAVGTLRLLDAVQSARVPALVYLSSVGTYPAAVDDEPVDEHTAPTGVGHVAYSVQKAYVEMALDEFEARTSCRVVRLRPGLVLQRRAGHEYERLFLGWAGTAALRVARGLRVPVPLPASLRFPVVGTADVAQAVVLACHLDVAGSFNLAAEPPVTASHLAAALEVPWVPVPWFVLKAAVRGAFALRLAPLDPAWVDLIRHIPLLDSRRARGTLAWVPSLTGEQALRQAVEGVLASTHGPTPPLGGGATGHHAPERRVASAPTAWRRPRPVRERQ